MELKERILAIGIAIVLALFIGFAANTIMPSKQWDDFCDQYYPGPFDTQQSCEANGGRWNAPDMVPERGAPAVPTKLDNQSQPVGWCDVNYFCNQEYESYNESYSRNLFVGLLVVGIAVFIVGALLRMQAVAAGLMGGAVLTIIYGTLRYWGRASDIFRTVVLGIVLAILIWLGYKRIGKTIEEHTRKGKKRK
ncbi:hypothetical protein JXB02_06105 [Candidatus Woesearchaeota archaeon]|nr:hypothetical protein [Candidatus Woesearchaeota archaeon]